MNQGHTQLDDNGSNITKSSNQLSLQWHKHHDTLISLLNQAWKQQEFVDVTLSAQGKCIEVHRIILCASSQYFQDILTQKNCLDKQAIFFLKDVDFEDLEALVHYMYKGEVRIDEHRLGSFLQTAKSLGVRGLSTYEDQQLPIARDLMKTVNNKTRKRKISSNSFSSLKEDESNVILSVGVELETSNIVPKDEDHHINNEYISDPTPSYYTSQKFARTDGLEASLELDGTNFIEPMRNQTISEVHNLAGISTSSSGPLVNPVYFHDAKTNEFDGTSLDHNSSNRYDSDGPFSCARCGRLYKWKQARNRHLKYECGVKPQFPCPVCQTSFHYKNALQRHMETHNRHK